MAKLLHTDRPRSKTHTQAYSNIYIYINSYLFAQQQQWIFICTERALPQSSNFLPSNTPTQALIMHTYINKYQYMPLKYMYIEFPAISGLQWIFSLTKAWLSGYAPLCAPPFPPAAHVRHIYVEHFGWPFRLYCILMFEGRSWSLRSRIMSSKRPMKSASCQRK